MEINVLEKLQQLLLQKQHYHHHHIHYHRSKVTICTQSFNTQ